MHASTQTQRWRWWALIALITTTTTLIACPKDDEEPSDLAPCENLAQIQSRAGGRIETNAPGGFTFADYTITVGEGSVAAKLPNPCGNAIAARLEQSACSFCNTQGTRCEELVEGIFATPPLECSTCGDGICAGDENETNCAQDCTLNCGDGLCEPGEEDLCPIDCATPCGNGVCESNETNTTCPTDCNYTAGDGLCGLGENPVNSPSDCTGETCDGEGVCADSTCGDGFCQSYETTFNCPQDCCDAGCGFEENSGCSNGDVITCLPVGAGNCPEVVVEEECALGCIDGACVRCPQFNSIRLCEPDQPPRCEGSNKSVLCLPMPGYEGCFYEDIVACDDGLPSDTPSCEEGLCAGSCTESECPELGAQRCDNGERIQTCSRVENDPCLRWVTDEVCAQGARCDTNLGLVCGEQPTQGVNLPAIERVTPRIASVGDTVVLEGQTFGDDPGTVTFATNRTAEIVSWTDTQVSAIVPPGAEDGSIELRTTQDRTALAPFNLNPTLTRFTHCAEPGNTIEIYTNATIGSSTSLIEWDVDFFPGVTTRGRWSLFFGGSRFVAQVPIQAQPGPVAIINPDTDIRIPLETHLDLLEIGELDWSYGAYWEIPDTGLTRCSDGAQWLDNCPAEGSPGFGQDASFIQTPQDYILTEDLVEDPNTGLTWQRNMRPERPDMTWREARCVCRDLELGGFNDWRLPTLWELMTLQKLNPETRLYMLDRTAFPGTISNHWSSQSNGIDEAYLYPLNSTLRPSPVDMDRYEGVRCVRGGTSPDDAQPRFEAIQDETFQDRYTALMWTHNVHTNGSQGIPWLQALDHCNTLTTGGFDDWRLPNITELTSLYSPELFNGSQPREDLLQGSRLNAFWSSTPNLSSPDFAYVLRTIPVGTFDPNAPTIADVRTTDTTVAAVCVRNAAR